VLLLTAFLECSPGDREALRAAAATCAAETRREDGCLEYRFYEDTELPGEFAFVERWRDQHALSAHFASPHLARFQQVTAPLLTGRRGVLYEVDEGQVL
jgi:quinol monooxygenase YgiN